MEKFKRKKSFNFINSLFYILDKFIPLKRSLKLKFYLNLEFIFKRLAYEKSYLIFRNKHPGTQNTVNNLKKIVKKNYKVLDVGCGNGYIAYSLSNYVKQIICIDYNIKAIQQAKKKFNKKNIKFFLGDVLKMDKSKIKNIDMIICSHLIEHLDNPFSFLKSLKMFNSKIYIEVPDLENDNINQVKTKINSQLRFTDEDHVYEFDRSSLLNNLLLNLLIKELAFLHCLYCFLERVLNLKVSSLSPFSFVRGYANEKLRGPNGLNQSRASPTDDLIPSPSIDES